jgi:nucleoid DNA-binding protein
MNKKQLIAQLSGSLNLSKADAERTFDTITNTILETQELESKFKSVLLKKLSSYQLSHLKKCSISN